MTMELGTPIFICCSQIRTASGLFGGYGPMELSTDPGPADSPFPSVVLSFSESLAFGEASLEVYEQRSKSPIWILGVVQNWHR